MFDYMFLSERCLFFECHLAMSVAFLRAKSCCVPGVCDSWYDGMNNAIPA